VSVKLNDLIGPYIKSYKGVRQGDPMSPILFNFVADSLIRMIIKAQKNNKFCGLIDHIIEKGVDVLQYADDTIICLKHSIEGARNLKLLLYMYEMMASLKINFLKSEVITINDEENWADTYAAILNCQVGSFPIKYLGVLLVPVGYTLLTGHPF
jgi:retron-type reverse transcriptase